MNESIFHFPRDLRDRQTDAHFGVARFSGFWTQVDYTAAYAKAAAVLFETARQNSELDEVAIPLLFLQRHTVELALKDFISVLAALLADDHPAICKKATEESVTTHNLATLQSRAAQLLTLSALGQLPSQFDLLLQHFDTFERGAIERARFGSVKTGKHTTERSLPQGGDPTSDLLFDATPQVVLPLGHIMVLVRELLTAMRLDNDEAVFSQACYLLHDKINRENEEAEV